MTYLEGPFSFFYFFARPFSHIYHSSLASQTMSRSALSREKPKATLPVAAPILTTQMYYSTDMYGTGVIPQTGMMYPQYLQIPHQQQPIYPILQPELTIQNQEEDQIKKKDELPIHGNQSNFNINSLLFNNIMESEYFKALYQLGTYHEVIGNVLRFMLF